MVDTVSKHDFIEIDYTGKLADGTVFDTTKEEVAHEANMPHTHGNVKSIVVCLGESQLLPGLDEFLSGKEIGKTLSVTLLPEQAFGKRDVKKVKIVPMNVFKEHKVQPRPGLELEVDGERGVVRSVSGGRIIVNFNHPVAGKEVVYEVTINKKITDTKEKLSFYLHSILRIPVDKLKLELTDGKAKVELPMVLPPQFTDALAEKIKEIVKVEVEFVSKKA
jgi:FKBP-type peptidyl-prolyl cis-trans isomerase SlyD